VPGSVRKLPASTAKNKLEAVAEIGAKLDGASENIFLNIGIPAELRIKVFQIIGQKHAVKAWLKKFTRARLRYFLA